MAKEKNSSYFSEFRNYLQAYYSTFKTNKIPFRFSDNEPLIEIDYDLFSKLSDEELFEFFKNVYGISRASEAKDISAYLVYLNQPNLAGKVYSELKKYEEKPFIQRFITSLGATFEHLPLISTVYAPIASKFKFDTKYDDIYLLHRELKKSHNLGMTAQDWVWDIGMFAGGVLDSLALVAGGNAVLKGVSGILKTLGFSGIFAAHKAIRELTNPYEPNIFSKEGLIGISSAFAEGLIYPVQLKFATFIGHSTGSALARAVLKTRFSPKGFYYWGYISGNSLFNYTLERARGSIYEKIYGIERAKSYDDYNFVFDLLATALDVVFTIPEARQHYYNLFNNIANRAREVIKMPEEKIVEAEVSGKEALNKLFQTSLNLELSSSKIASFAEGILSDRLPEYITIKTYNLITPQRLDLIYVRDRINYTIESLSRLSSLRNSISILTLKNKIERDIAKSYIDVIDKAITIKLNSLEVDIPGVEISIGRTEKIRLRSGATKPQESEYSSIKLEEPFNFISSLAIRVRGTKEPLAVAAISPTKLYNEVLAVSENLSGTPFKISEGELLLNTILGTYISEISKTMLPHNLFSFKERFRSIRQILDGVKLPLENFEIVEKTSGTNYILKGGYTLFVPDTEIRYKIYGEKKIINLNDLIKRELGDNIVGEFKGENYPIEESFRSRGIKIFYPGSGEIPGYFRDDDNVFQFSSSSANMDSVILFHTNISNLENVFDALADWHKRNALANPYWGMFYEGSVEMFKLKNGDILGLFQTQYRTTNVVKNFEIHRYIKDEYFPQLDEIYIVHNHPYPDVGGFSIGDIHYAMHAFRNILKKIRDREIEIDTRKVNVSYMVFSSVGQRIIMKSNLEDAGKALDDLIHLLASKIVEHSNLNPDFFNKISESRRITSYTANDWKQFFDFMLDFYKDILNSDNKFLVASLNSFQMPFQLLANLLFWRVNVTNFLGRLFVLSGGRVDENQFYNILNNLIGISVHLNNLSSYIDDLLSGLFGLKFNAVLITELEKNKDLYLQFIDRIGDKLQRYKEEIGIFAGQDILRKFINSKISGGVTNNYFDDIDFDTIPYFKELARLYFERFEKLKDNVEFPKFNIFDIYANMATNLLGNYLDITNSVLSPGQIRLISYLFRGLPQKLLGRESYQRDYFYRLLDWELDVRRLQSEPYSRALWEEVRRDFIDILEPLTKLKNVSDISLLVRQNAIEFTRAFKRAHKREFFNIPDIWSMSLARKVIAKLYSSIKGQNPDDILRDYFNYVFSVTPGEVFPRMDDYINGIKRVLSERPFIRFRDEREIIEKISENLNIHHFDILLEILKRDFDFASKIKSNSENVNRLKDILSQVSPGPIDENLFRRVFGFPQKGIDIDLYSRRIKLFKLINYYAKENKSVDDIKSDLLQVIDNSINEASKKIEKNNEKIKFLNKNILMINNQIDNVLKQIKKFEFQLKKIEKEKYDAILDISPKEMPEVIKKYNEKINEIENLLNEAKNKFHRYRDALSHYENTLTGYEKSNETLQNYINELSTFKTDLLTREFENIQSLYHTYYQIYRKGWISLEDISIYGYYEWVAVKLKDLGLDILKAADENELNELIERHGLNTLIEKIPLEASDYISLAKELRESVERIISYYRLPKRYEGLPFGLKQLFKRESGIEKIKDIEDYLSRIESEYQSLIDVYYDNWAINFLDRWELFKDNVLIPGKVLGLGKEGERTIDDYINAHFGDLIKDNPLFFDKIKKIIFTEKRGAFLDESEIKIIDEKVKGLIQPVLSDLQSKIVERLNEILFEKINPEEIRKYEIKVKIDKFIDKFEEEYKKVEKAADKENVSKVLDDMISEYGLKGFDYDNYRQERRFLEPIFVELTEKNLSKLNSELLISVDKAIEDIKSKAGKKKKSFGEINLSNYFISSFLTYLDKFSKNGLLNLDSVPINLMDKIIKKLNKYIDLFEIEKKPTPEIERIEGEINNLLSDVLEAAQNDFYALTSILLGKGFYFDPTPRIIDEEYYRYYQNFPFYIARWESGKNLTKISVSVGEKQKDIFHKLFEKQSSYDYIDLVKNIRDFIVMLYKPHELSKERIIELFNVYKDTGKYIIEKRRKIEDIIGASAKDFEENILPKIIEFRDEILRGAKFNIYANDFRKIDEFDRITNIVRIVNDIKFAEDKNRVVDEHIANLRSMGVDITPEDYNKILDFANKEHYDFIEQILTNKILGESSVLPQTSFKKASDLIYKIEEGLNYLDEDLNKFAEDIHYYLNHLISYFGLSDKYIAHEPGTIKARLLGVKGRLREIFNFVYGLERFIKRETISALIKPIEKEEKVKLPKYAQIILLPPDLISQFLGTAGEGNYIIGTNFNNFSADIPGMEFPGKKQSYSTKYLNFEFLPSPWEAAVEPDLKKDRGFAGMLGNMFYHFSKNHHLPREILAFFESHRIFTPFYKEINKIILSTASYEQRKIDKIIKSYKELDKLRKDKKISDDLLEYYATHTFEDFQNDLRNNTINLSEKDIQLLIEIYRSEFSDDIHPAAFLKKTLMELGLELYNRGLMDDITFRTMFGRYLHKTYYSFISGGALDAEQFKVYLANTKIDYSTLKRRMKTILPELRLEEVKDPAFLMAASAVAETMTLARRDAIRMIAKSNYINNWVSPTGLIFYNGDVYTYAELRPIIKNEEVLVRGLRKQLNDIIRKEKQELEKSGLYKKEEIANIIKGKYGDEIDKINSLREGIKKVKVLFSIHNRVLNAFSRLSKQRPRDKQLFLNEVGVIFKSKMDKITDEEFKLELEDLMQKTLKYFDKNWGNLRVIPQSEDAIIGGRVSVKSYSELSGQIVDRGLYEDISTYYDIINPNFRLDFVEGLKSFVGSLYRTFKVSKVIFNFATTYINNFISNIFQMMVSTGASVLDVFDYLGKAVSHIIARSPLYEEALNSGLMEGSFSKAELFELKNIFEKMYIEKQVFPKTFAERVIKKLKTFSLGGFYNTAVETMSDIYSSIDSLFRLAYILYYNDKGIYRIFDANGAINKNELAKAMSEAYIGTINYAHTSEYIKQARRPENWYSVFFSPFVTYKAKIMGVFARALFNRPLTTIAVLSFPVLLKLYLWSLIPDDEREKIALYSVEAYKSVGIVYTPLKIDNKYVMFNYNFHPLIDHISAAQALLNQNFSELINFTGFGISGSAQFVNIVATGRDIFTGVKVYSTYDPFTTKLFNTLLFGLYNFLPTNINVGLKYLGADVKQIRDNKLLFTKLLGLNTYMRSIYDMYRIKHSYLKMLEAEIARDMGILKRRYYYGDIDYNQYINEYKKLYNRRKEIRIAYYREIGGLGVSPYKSLFLNPNEEVEFTIEEEE